MAIKIHIAPFRNGTTGKWVLAFSIVFLLYVIIPAFHASHGQALVGSDLMSP